MINITPLLETLRLQKIDDEEYFSAKYSNFISNSRLGLINPKQGGSVESFFEGFKPIYSSSLDIGTAVHSLTLQKDLFNIVDEVDKPTGKMGVLAEELFKTWKGSIPPAVDIIEAAKKIDYYGGNLSPKRIEEVKEKCQNFWISKNRYLRLSKDPKKVDLYLDPKSRETAYNCIKALENSTYIQKLLKPEQMLEGMDNIKIGNELAILLDIEVEVPETPKFRLRLKAKLDNFTIDTMSNVITVNDIKTLGRTVDQMNINIEKYHYNRELALYAFLLKLVAEKYYGVVNPTVKGNYLVVSTIPNYYTKVVPMTQKMFSEGLSELQHLLRLVAQAVATDHHDFGIWE